MISIILQCIGCSTLFLIVYHFWFASKDNQLDISENGQATQEPLNPNWVEKEHSISSEDLINVADQMINEVHNTRGSDKKVEEKNEAIIFQDEPQSGFHNEDSGSWEDEIEFQQDKTAPGVEQPAQDGESNAAMENDNESTDRETDDLETLPSIDYLKES